MDFHPLIQCTPQQFVVNAEPYNLRRHLTVGSIHESTGTAPFEPTTGQKPGSLCSLPLALLPVSSEYFLFF